MASASCVRLAAIHPYHQHQTFRKSKALLSSPTHAHANIAIRSLIKAPYSFRNPLMVTGQNHRLQLLPLKNLHNANFFISTKSKSTLCMETVLCKRASSSENTPQIPTTEICILVFVYIIPFLNRLNLLPKFPVLKYAMSPIMPLVGFYQSIPTLGLITFLAFFIIFVRYRNSDKFQYYLVMDCVVVIASLVRPFLMNPVPSAGGALGFKFQLLNILELLGFQTCVHSCSEYLGSVQWVEEEEKVNEEEEKKVNVALDVPVLPDPFIDILANMVKVVLKTDGKEGRRQGKSLVLKFIREHNSLHSDVNLAATINKNMLSSCQRCLYSLLNLFKQASGYNYVNTDIALEVDNLLWLLDILVDRQAAEEFSLMWANQQEMANLHKRFENHNKRSRHLVSCITTRLLVGIGNAKILAAKDTRQMLLKTWFQPLLDDYSSLRKLESFDPKVVEENIERTILELTPEDQHNILMDWFECFLKKGNACPDLLKAYESWCRRSFGKTPPLSLPFEKER